MVSSDPEFKSHSAVELTPGRVDSARHPSEVCKMSASYLVSCVGVVTCPELCPIAKETASAAPTLCTEYGPNGWMVQCQDVASYWMALMMRLRHMQTSDRLVVRSCSWSTNARACNMLSRVLVVRSYWWSLRGRGSLVFMFCSWYARFRDRILLDVLTPALLVVRSCQSCWRSAHYIMLVIHLR